VIASLVGFGLDRLIGTTPIFTLVFALAGLVGATIGIFYTYRAQMEAAGSARRIARERGAER
jgi:F0F1-type ATP synthase assembly protein I